MSVVAETPVAERGGQVRRQRWSEVHKRQIVTDAHEPGVSMPTWSEMFHVCPGHAVLPTLSLLDRDIGQGAAMRYDRALAISKRHEELLALVKSGAYSSEALASQLGVSTPTVYRDVYFLKRQGHPIESVRLSSRWVYRLARKVGSNNQRRMRRSG